MSVESPLRTEVVDASADGVTRAAQLLREGEVVAFPTETVYGLGARADRSDAVAKVFAAKGRPADKPLILHVANVAQAQAATVGWDARAQALADAFWPGPVSIILKAAPWVVPEVTAGGTSVAVRVIGLALTRALIEEVGCAIAAPSANLSGAEPPTTATGVLETLEGRIPMVLDGGETPVRTPSTLVSLVGDGITVIREGSISRAAILGALPVVTTG